MIKLLINLAKRKGRGRRGLGVLSGVTGAVLGVLLFAAKLTAGLLTGSLSILSDAFNNLSDAGTSVFVALGFKLSQLPASKKHPFGHGRVEYVTGLILSVIIIVVGVELFKEAVSRVLSPSPAVLSPAAAVILVISVLVKLWMFFFNRALFRETGSQVLKTSSLDSLLDAVATTAVLSALAVEKFTGLTLDGFMGAAVALFIIWTGISAAKESSRELIGNPPDAGFVESISETVLSHAGIVGMHDLIVHDYGPGRRMISLHAEVDDKSDLVAAHDVIDHIELELKEKFDCEATIHVDPVACGDPETESIKAKLKELLLAIDKDIVLHDFRVKRAATHTNLIFDLALPFKHGLSEREVEDSIREALAAMGKKYYAVIKFERPFV